MSNETNYSIDDIGHFILGLLTDENINDPIVDVIKKLQRADIENCSPCVRLQKALIEEVKIYDAPFDESRLTGGKLSICTNRKVEHSKNPEHTLIYSYDMVCDLCGSNEWHVTLFYKNSPTGSGNGWFYGDDGDYSCDDVWCHECESYRNLVAPDEYEKDGE